MADKDTSDRPKIPPSQDKKSRDPVQPPGDEPKREPAVKKQR
jgi:hypothetical protein